MTVRFFSDIGVYTHRLLSTSFLQFVSRILSGNPKKELPRTMGKVSSS